jgi:hypothetical protein
MDLSPVQQPLLNDVFTATGNATLADHGAGKVVSGLSCTTCFQRGTSG